MKTINRTEIPMQIRPAISLDQLIADLRELEAWPEVYVSAPLLLSDVLRALGWPDGAIMAALGVDLAAVEGATVAVLS